MAVKFPLSAGWEWLSVCPSCTEHRNNDERYDLHGSMQQAMVQGETPCNALLVEHSDHCFLNASLVKQH
jgi:hypothetical protein